jgi:hypothetical protein
MSTKLGHCLSDRSQKQVTVGKTIPSSRRSTSIDLTPQSRAKLIDNYGDDCALLKDYYRPEQPYGACTPILDNG